MTLARVRRPTCEARPAAWKASPSAYTPPWKYSTTWRGSIPSMVISAVGTPPRTVTVTSAGSGCGQQLPQQSALLVEIDVGREGQLSQDRVEESAHTPARAGSDRPAPDSARRASR